eukprot:TRINITY_DN1828_c0_g1_i1.p1 TRINITY_DN1828_c0_g1~~TRINITY_DN1828_c0_g1_i1.p1  ORF type:complete len:433 (+),score=72.55 TRINITY_DN1828_c0_g1_i1:165-1301(+)
MPHYWIRAEAKPFERRTPVMPRDVKVLVDRGHSVTVEKSVDRCVKDEEYASVAGVKMAEEGSWQSDAPSDAVVLGLKELPHGDTRLKNDHIYFAHCYKHQGGWKEILARHQDHQLFDMEFLCKGGRRVAAFGKSAGFVGMAVGILNWCHQQQIAKAGVEGKADGPANPLLSALDCHDYETYNDLVAFVQSKLDAARALSDSSEPPSILVIGALGRCGYGAVDMASRVGINAIKWDLAETKAGGPFPQLLDVDVLVNCIFLSQPITPFLTMDMLATKGRKLSTMVDISCDTSNPHNPVPVYRSNTTFDKPAMRVIDGSNPFDVVSIDHLPSLVPRESSDEYSELLAPYLAAYDDGSEVWEGALSIYREKLKEAGLPVNV